jgi:hypothetical protein
MISLTTGFMEQNIVCRCQHIRDGSGTISDAREKHHSSARFKEVCRNIGGNDFIDCLTKTFLAHLS